MKRHMLPYLVSLLLVLPFPAIAQEADPFEEEWIQSRAEQGDSHASGLRPELGPVILGNPTQAVVVLRVGLSYSFTSTGSFTTSRSTKRRSPPERSASTFRRISWAASTRFSTTRSGAMGKRR